MYVRFAITSMSLQDGLEILQIFFADFFHRQFYVDCLSQMLFGIQEGKNALGDYLRSLFFLLQCTHHQ
jgi:hypothetical protein